jgi:hypothetical protein
MGLPAELQTLICRVAIAGEAMTGKLSPGPGAPPSYGAPPPYRGPRVGALEVP